MRKIVIALFLILFTLTSFAQRSAKQYYSSAMEQVKAGDYEKAIELFSVAMSMDPINDIPVYGRACAKMNTGDIEGAIFDFHMAIELNPHSYQSYHNLGVIEYTAKNYEKAKEYFEYSVELDPTNVSALLSLSQLSYDAENIEDAIDYFDRTFEIDKTLRLLTVEQLLYCYIHRASCLSITGEFEKALKDINNALKIDATDFHTHYIKGSILYELKSYDVAIKSLDTALELNADFGYGYFVRAMAKRDAKDKKGARNDFAKAKQFGYIAE